jgi:hypothetical protein
MPYNQILLGWELSPGRKVIANSGFHDSVALLAKRE